MTLDRSGALQCNEPEMIKKRTAAKTERVINPKPNCIDGLNSCRNIEDVAARNQGTVGYFVLFTKCPELVASHLSDCRMRQGLPWCLGGSVGLSPLCQVKT